MYHFDLTIDMEIYESSLRNEAVFVLTILVESPKWYLYNVKDPVFLRGLHNNNFNLLLMPCRRNYTKQLFCEVIIIQYMPHSQDLFIKNIKFFYFFINARHCVR